LIRFPAATFRSRNSPETGPDPAPVRKPRTPPPNSDGHREQALSRLYIGFQNQRTGERRRHVFALKNLFLLGQHLSYPFGYDFQRMTNCEQVNLVNDGFADYQQSQHFGLKGTV
jgi:hypothetical protein